MWISRFWMVDLFVPPAQPYHRFHLLSNFQIVRHWSPNPSSKSWISLSAHLPLPGPTNSLKTQFIIYILLKYYILQMHLGWTNNVDRHKIRRVQKSWSIEWRHWLLITASGVPGYQLTLLISLLCATLSSRPVLILRLICSRLPVPFRWNGLEWSIVAR